MSLKEKAGQKANQRHLLYVFKSLLFRICGFFVILFIQLLKLLNPIGHFIKGFMPGFGIHIRSIAAVHFLEQFPLQKCFTLFLLKHSPERVPLNLASTFAKSRHLNVLINSLKSYQFYHFAIVKGMVGVVEFDSVPVKLHPGTTANVLILGHSTAHFVLHPPPIIHHLFVEPHLGALVIELALVVNANFLVFCQRIIRKLGIAFQKLRRGNVFSAWSNVYNTVFTVHDTVTSK